MTFVAARRQSGIPTLMFKRVEKRRQKKEDADKLALDEQWQEILGFHDTDSEESASEEDEDEQTSDDGEGVDYSEHEEGEDQEVTVSQALLDPLYVLSPLQPEVKACIICPGKVLKGPTMEGIHLASNAHIRRFGHFNHLAADAKPTQSARKLFRSFTEKDLSVSSTKPVSKRAEKRKLYHARQKQRRGKLKEKMARKAELSVSGALETKPSTPNEEKRSSKGPQPHDYSAKTEVEKTLKKKKRKINESDEPAIPTKIFSPKRQKTTVKEKKRASGDDSGESDETRTMLIRIFRSSADRAKIARLKALSPSKVSTSKHSKISKHLS